jgi:Ca-activated chloride channel homolog
MLTIGQIASGTEAAEDPAADAGFGAISTTRGNLPLSALDVRADIVALTAGVEVVQEFANPFDEPLEATYIFPLPDRAALTALRFEADGRTVDGVLTERAQARREYDQAISAGRRAAIAEEERPDVFTMRVGNILPGEQVVVRLSLSQPLPFEDGAATFRFPLVIAPRYIPGNPLPGAAAGSGTQPDTDAVPDASRITPPVLLPGFPHPVRLGITARIDPGGLPVSQVRSSLHAVGQSAGDDGSTIITIEPGERLDRDFILRLAVADADDIATSLVLRQDDPPSAGTGTGAGDDAGDWGTGTFMLTLVPPAASAAVTDRDMVVVLDRSGSMSGWKMVAARRAAARIVDTLDSSDRFAVLCFDNTVQQPPELAGRLVAGTDRNRFRAVEFLASVTAHGGTEMLGALQQAAGLLADQTRSRVLVLVTDGQVGNEDQILDMIGPRLTGTRVHVVGIDRAVNAGFLSRLASVGRGRCELVESEDRLDAAMTRIHRRIASPVVTGLSVSSADVALVKSAIAPSPLPGLFDGAAVTIFGRYRGYAPAGITVRGTAADGSPYERTLTAVQRAGDASGTPATALWARARLRDLEDAYACVDPGRDDVLESLEHQIVATSLRFGVACRFTAFVAVDSRVVTDGSTPHRVTLPVQVPSGWEMFVPGQAALPTGVAMAASAAGQGPVPQRVDRWKSTSGVRSAPGPSAAAQLGASSSPSARASRKRNAGMLSPGAQAPRPAEVRGSLPVPDWAKTQIADELAWLDSVPERSAPALARDLADLGSRLHGLLMWLSDARVEASEISRLRELADKLSSCDGRVMAAETLRALRAEAREVLRGFAGDAEPGGRPRQFWKRPGGAG